MGKNRWVKPVAWAVLLGVSAPAMAQMRDLDRAASDGRVYDGRYDGEPATFALTLAAGESVELQALPVAGSDPLLKVFDQGSGELLAENDDQPGSLAARVRLRAEARQRLRIEVTAPVPGARFRLLVLPSDYRPSPPREIAAGARHQGELESGDEQLFRFTAARGEAWEFALAAADGSAIDPMLQVFAGTVASGEPLASDDDGGDGLNSLLRFVPPRAGSYTVRASGLGASGGAYLFTAALAGDLPLAEVEELVPGRTARGTLRASETRLYRLTPAAASGGGGRLVVEMNAAAGSDLDPMLEAGFDTPLGFSAMLSDDDGGEGLNSRLEIDLDEFAQGSDWLERLRIRAGRISGEGPYEIVVTALRGD